MDKKLRYSIVIPAFKEAAIIGQSLHALAQALDANPSVKDKTEIIVVAADGGDDTAQIARSLKNLFADLIVIEPGIKVGKGRDVRAGILSARGDFIIFTDADMATPPCHILPALAKLEQGADMVIGVRPLKKIHNTLGRRLRSVISNLLIRTLAVSGIEDTQCGFKGFSSAAAKQLFTPLETMGWGFDIEILARARALRFKIAKLKINDWYDPKVSSLGLGSESNLRANMSTLKELLTIAAKRLGGHYKKP